MIPGLENAEFVRYGVMHRNTYINSPMLLTDTYRMRKFDKIYFAGQITGVEGYVESAASGLIAGRSAALAMSGKCEEHFDSETAIGALAQYVSNEGITNFQPMNVNFGIMKDLGKRIRDKKQKAEEYSMRSLKRFEPRTDEN